MDESSLLNAMRPGSRNPTEQRSPDDLGRFGLGLKTASLSQCRSLTVVTRKDGRTTARRWDLDYVALKDDWLLLIGPPEDAGEAASLPLDLRSGTLVLWTKLDRLAGRAKSRDTDGKERFFEIARLVERHLAMTFHRFLEASGSRFQIYVNGNRLQAWDPFMEDHPATLRHPVERVRYSGGTLVVEGFVLPHKDRLTPGQLDSGGGPDGWLAHQGFFVYRNKRLLVPGGWLMLNSRRPWPRDDLHRLARIRMDIPNNTDDEWKIDIRKSIAAPPAEVSRRLRELAERVRSEAREILAYRGGRTLRTAARPILRAWTSVETSRGPAYKIDRTHPSVERVLEGSGKLRKAVEEMLRVIEDTVPVQRIWLDTAERGDVPVGQAEGVLDPETQASMSSLYRYMIHDLRLAPSEARERLMLIEPFNKYPAAVQALPEKE